jgi:endonuclease-3
MAKNSRDTKILFDSIIQEFGWKKIELDYSTPFQLLCAVILSAQTTDKQVNKVTPPFFEKIQEAQDIVNMSLEEIEWYLKYVNFFRNKSRYIKETGTILANKYGWLIPNDIDLIQTFPGVWVKTAKVVLSVLYDMPYVGVDTHIHRVLNRIWIVSTNSPIQTDKEIERILDTETQRKIHHPVVLFGRYRCIARKPKCHECHIAKYCDYSKSVSETVESP